MAERVIQSSFNVGELAPALWARTDLAKYHSAAALARNVFVDYRGGLSTRPGTQYINRCGKPASKVRLIPFQASFSVSYVLEFGDGYIRFINNKQPVVEAGIALGAANNYAIGDTVLLSGSNTVYDGSYFQVTGTAPLALADLAGNNIPIPAAGTTARVYTLPSPFTAADLANIKYTQNVATLIICTPNRIPYILNLISPTNWTLAPITFGSSAGVPQGVVSETTLSSGRVTYAYVVTAVDQNGEESLASAPTQLAGYSARTNQSGTNRVLWVGVANAKYYNVYAADATFFGEVPPGTIYGYIGSSQTTTFDDTNIGPDFTNTPPNSQVLFLGNGVKTVTLTANADYTQVPTVTASAPASGSGALLSASLSVDQVTLDSTDASAGYAVGDQIQFQYGVLILVNTIGTGGKVTGFSIISKGAITSGNTPTNPQPQVSTTGSGTGIRVDMTWNIGAINIVAPGAGYTAPPAITFTPAGATATATIDTSTDVSYPTVAAFYQQRLFLGGSVNSGSTFYLSQPGAPYNFNVNQPVQADDSITASLVSTSLNTIKAAVATSAGLIIFTDKATWLVNGGSAGSAVSPSSIVANPQSYNGASDLPPIVANFDILYVQAKGSIVRDSTYNIYANIYTGQDISVLSSHLFYGYTLLEWAFAEEPFKVVWAVRSDGMLLSLTFLKEQEFTGWAHSDTQGGTFESVASVVEPSGAGFVDAVYVVVNRNGVRNIERLADRNWTTRSQAWCVDCAVRYSGAPTKTFSGAQQLAGQTVTGLADGAVIPAFVMPANGQFTLATAASVVTVGLGFTAQVQTLPLDVGEPTVQGKMKKIVSATLRLQQALGLKIGSSFNTLVSMKDTTLGNVGKMSNQIVTDLVTCDTDTILDPTYTIPGQYCIQMDLPYPATILGVIPKFEIGDSK